MRILVVADIHANWTALQAVHQAEPKFDACLCVGDLVDYGVQPQPCIDWAREHCNVVVRGNHDHAVAQQVPARRGGGFRLLAAATRPLHDSLDAASITWLARLPVTYYVELGGYSFHMVHATPRDPMDEYLTDESEWVTRLETIDADFVLVGHTHIPMHLQAGRKQLLNPGSVGQPRDGIAKAAYAIIEDGNVQLKRVDYALEDELSLVRKAGVTGEALQVAETIIRNGFLVRPDR